MVDKALDEVRGKKPTIDQEAEHLETKPDLTPDPSVTVPKEDSMSSGAGEHKDRMKHLFEKSRTKRSDVISREEGDHPDAERVRLLMEEASGGERGEKQHLDTNRNMGEGEPEVPDAFKDEVRNEVARRMAEGQEDARRQKHEKKNVNEADDALPTSIPNAIVTVKILGQEYDAPQQDIDDAGGIELYQKSRAANLRLQRIATLEKTLTANQKQEPARGEQQDADPSTDGLDEADIARLRDRVVDAMVDGDDISAVDKVLKEELTSRRRARPKTNPTTNKPEGATSPSQLIQEAQLELERQQVEDMREANEMMRAEYQDVLNNKNALNMARGRFHVLAADPRNAGRTQKELSRESANWVRSFVKKFSQQAPERDDMEDERQRRIVTKRKLPQPSRSNVAVAGNDQPDERMSTRDKRREYLKTLQAAREGRR